MLLSGAGVGISTNLRSTHPHKDLYTTMCSAYYGGRGWREKEGRGEGGDVV